MGFEVVPAIDLLEGRCVRLAQGRYEQATVYGDDPAEVARGFASHPIPRLHVVDLDGAREGRPVNAAAVRAIADSIPGVPVQLGGGIRSVEAVEQALAAGVDRVVLGTVALREPELARQAARRFPGRIAIGVDARGGRVAVEGWLEASTATAAEVARRFEDAGVAAIVYTDIERDGMLSGPNYDATVEVAAAVDIPVLLSGGVGCEDDVLRAAGIGADAAGGRRLAGAIVGRALYTGAVDLGRVLERVACS